MYSYKIYEVAGGFGFNICQDDSVIIVQDFNPNIEGFVPMSKETAEIEAECVIRRLEA